jgi:hypothetical protein
MIIFFDTDLTFYSHLILSGHLWYVSYMCKLSMDPRVTVKTLCFASAIGNPLDERSN